MNQDHVSRQEYLGNILEGKTTSQALKNAQDRLDAYLSCNPIDEQAVKDTRWCIRQIELMYQPRVRRP